MRQRHVRVFVAGVPQTVQYPTRRLRIRLVDRRTHDIAHDAAHPSITSRRDPRESAYAGRQPASCSQRSRAGHTDRRLHLRPGGLLVSRHTNAGTSYNHHDWLDSVTDTNGTRQVRHSYDTFGARTTTAPNTPVPGLRPHRRVHRPTDKLLNLRARRYDTSTGRFTASDPIQLRPDQPYTADYVHADNAPTYLTDPSGKCSVKNWFKSLLPHGPFRPDA
ncbi:RHS repeat-associated core domain-containing protein [Kitasatospora purpeofusca]|uniref:RHS repeat-associated core domain-containing protein n=1 Tax=Kitasatospora purpeofusca TaxID=67352 RepID=UPI0033D0BD96